jgi:predicted HicB family RNase H-like nuclease
MTILSYKGYRGSIEYEDGQLVIQLLHIYDFITTTCDAVGKAEEAFHELVDDYLATCEETGRLPDKPYKGSLNIRMPPELHRRIAMAATAAGVSLNAWIMRACEAAVSVSQTIDAHVKYPPPEYVHNTGLGKHRASLPSSDQLDFPHDNIVDLAELRRINKLRFKEAASLLGEFHGQSRTG